MNTLLVASALLSWLLLAVLSLITYALARQIGVLHERIRPAGALALENTMKVGDRAVQMSLSALDGRLVSIGGRHANGRDTLLFFISPNCPVCKTLLPAMKSLAKRKSGTLDIVFASDGDIEEQRHFVNEQDLGGIPYTVSTELGLAFRISKLPYAVLIDAAGTIAAHGLVNNQEHIESLFELRLRQRTESKLSQG